ncbi:MFS transporter [Chloroflexota bacterium]
MIIGLGHNLGLTIAIDKALTNWFVKKRGLAFGVRFLIIGVCGVIVLPVVTWLVTTQGWRMTCLIWAGLMFIGVPLVWLFVKQKRPEYYGLLPDGAEVEPDLETDTDTMIDRGVEYAVEATGEVEFTLRQAMKTRSYWIIAMGWAGMMLIGGGVNIHMIPFLTDRGISPTVASGMMAMMVFFTIPSRFLGGLLGDYFRREHLHFLLAGSFLLPAVGITAFLLNQTTAMVYVMLAMYGLGQGASTPLKLLTGGRYFGRKAFTSIQGTAMAFSAPISLLSPVYAGWIYDTTGSYIIAFITFAVIAAIGTVLMLLLRPPKPPADITNVRKFV